MAKVRKYHTSVVNLNTGEINSYEKKVKEIKKPFSILSYLLAVIFLVIIVNFIIKGASGEPLTFTSFLDMLVNAPVVRPVLNVLSFNFGDWGIFNGLRDFLQFFVTIVNFLLYVCQSLFLVLEYFLYFLRWFFL